MKNYKSYYVPIFFTVLSFLGFIFSGVSGDFILGELYSRFVRNSLFLLALIMPIIAGMGINFSITIGALVAQVAMILVLDLKLDPVIGFVATAVISVIISTIIGSIIGSILNKARGKEMIASMVIGFLGTSIFQLIFMVGYGTIIKPLNKDLLISNGIGIKSMLDVSNFKAIYKGILTIKVGNVYGSLVPLFIIMIIGFIVFLITKSKIGYHMKAVGTNLELSEKLGIDVNKIRKRAIIISTILASLSQLMFVQNLGILNVYTGHLNIDVFSAAALLVGGATLKNANIRNAVIGIFLFHTLFVVSPLAGQKVFNNAALGEYFRSFIAYGTIVFALVMNLRNEKGAIL